MNISKDIDDITNAALVKYNHDMRKLAKNVDIRKNFKPKSYITKFGYYGREDLEYDEEYIDKQIDINMIKRYDILKNNLYRDIRNSLSIYNDKYFCGILPIKDIQIEYKNRYNSRIYDKAIEFLYKVNGDEYWMSNGVFIQYLENKHYMPGIMNKINKIKDQNVSLYAKELTN